MAIRIPVLMLRIPTSLTHRGSVFVSVFAFQLQLCEYRDSDFNQMATKSEVSRQPANRNARYILAPSLRETLLDWCAYKPIQNDPFKVRHETEKARDWLHCGHKNQ